MENKIKQPKEVKKLINRKELISLISQSSGYHKYEVEDFLKHFVKVMQDAVIDDNKVKIEGLGVFQLKHYKPRTFYSAFNDLEYSVKTAPALSLKPDTWIRTMLQEAYGASSEVVEKEDKETES